MSAHHFTGPQRLANTLTQLLVLSGVVILMVGLAFGAGLATGESRCICPEVTR